MSLLKAPFTGEPQPFVETEMRFGGIQWLSPKVALLSDFSAQRTRARSWVIDPSLPDGGTPRPLWDYNIEDRIAAPGNLLFQYDPAADRAAADHEPATDKWYYLTGPGASKDQRRRSALSRSDGHRDGQDRAALAVRARRTTRPSSRSLDPAATKAIVRRESPTERPDYYVLDIASKQRRRG